MARLSRSPALRRVVFAVGPLGRRLAGLLRGPDPQLLEAGREGEITVARLRLILLAVILLIPLLQLVEGPQVDSWIGLGAVGIAFLLAFLIYRVAASGLGGNWVGFVSSLIDVTLVSSVLAAFVALGMANAAVNSRVVYSIYFLAISATSLRYDVRICLATGAGAILEYMGVIVLALASGHLQLQGEEALRYGVFEWSDQVGRLLLLATVTLVAMATVGRSRRLRYLSIRDGLTGLFNRSFLDERLEDELLRAHRGDYPLAVAMLDIDHFKSFNDTYGHRAGDSALRLLSQTLRRSLRATDLVARYGGEEFVVVFAGASEEVVRHRLEVLRRTVARVEMLEGSGIRLTLSAGFAVWPEDGQSSDEILLRADERLYEAKRLGRNRVVGPRRGRWSLPPRAPAAG